MEFNQRQQMTQCGTEKMLEFEYILHPGSDSELSEVEDKFK